LATIEAADRTRVLGLAPDAFEATRCQREGSAEQVVSKRSRDERLVQHVEDVATSARSRDPR